MKFAQLCSGSKGNCFVLVDEHLTIMVDCGSTKKYLTSSLESLGLSVTDFDALLITHDHTDHISQLKMMSGVPLYASKPLFEYPVNIVEPMKPFQLQHMTITPLALSHDAEKTIGFVFETWQEKLVYITDTGYLKQEYESLLKGADYIILESNHDVGMLMQTRRPQYVKIRIASDSGHLSNDMCASILERIVTENTKSIVLAHISQEANTRELALSTTFNALKNHPRLPRDLWISAAGQFELLKGGDWYEEGHVGSCGCTLGMEYLPER